MMGERQERSAPHCPQRPSARPSGRLLPSPRGPPYPLRMPRPCRTCPAVCHAQQSCFYLLLGRGVKVLTGRPMTKTPRRHAIWKKAKREEHGPVRTAPSAAHLTRAVSRSIETNNGLHVRVYCLHVCAVRMYMPPGRRGPGETARAPMESCVRDRSSPALNSPARTTDANDCAR